ncbi:MAG: hypothetical protein JWQ30_1127 [Sediminibacterium sp.]|nr:hypothetical protein [Sediminibacterium sp.]
MFRKCLLAGLLFVVLLPDANSQSLTVDTYSNQLLFNIFQDQPDTAIRPFLRLYLPSLLEKKITPADLGSSGGSKTQYSFEIHSFVFTTHPYLNSRITNGKIEFFCRRLHDGKGIQVYDVKLWLEFNELEDAEAAYSKILVAYDALTPDHKFSSGNGYRKAEFSDTKATKGINKIQFRITSDNLDKHRFKILFETDNEL